MRVRALHGLERRSARSSPSPSFCSLAILFLDKQLYDAVKLFDWHIIQLSKFLLGVSHRVCALQTSIWSNLCVAFLVPNLSNLNVC